MLHVHMTMYIFNALDIILRFVTGCLSSAISRLNLGYDFRTEILNLQNYIRRNYAKGISGITVANMRKLVSANTDIKYDQLPKRGVWTDADSDAKYQTDNPRSLI